MVKRVNGFSRPWSYYQLIVLSSDLVLSTSCYILVLMMSKDSTRIVLSVILSLLNASCMKYFYDVEVSDVESMQQYVSTKQASGGGNNHTEQVKLSSQACCVNIVRKRNKPYYCRECGKHVDGFDHHCIWLNTCIGMKNYGAFFVLVCICSIKYLYFVSIGVIAQLLWYNDYNRNRAHEVLSEDKEFVFYMLTSIFTLLSLVVFLAIATLACFHIHLVFVKKMSTFEWLVHRRVNRLNMMSPNTTERRAVKEEKSEARKQLQREIWQTAMAQRLGHRDGSRAYSVTTSQAATHVPTIVPQLPLDKYAMIERVAASASAMEENTIEASRLQDYIKHHRHDNIEDTCSNVDYTNDSSISISSPRPDLIKMTHDTILDAPIIKSKNSPQSRRILQTIAEHLGVSSNKKKKVAAASSLSRSDSFDMSGRSGCSNHSRSGYQHVQDCISCRVTSHMQSINNISHHHPSPGGALPLESIYTIKSPGRNYPHDIQSDLRLRTEAGAMTARSRRINSDIIESKQHEQEELV